MGRLLSRTKSLVAMKHLGCESSRNCFSSGRREESGNSLASSYSGDSSTAATASGGLRRWLARLPTPPAAECMTPSSKNVLDSAKAAFSVLDSDHDGQLSFDEFVDICMNRLALDLSEVELRRVFNKADIDDSGCISFEEFHHAVVGKAFFSHLFEEICGCPVPAFEVSKTYDYARPTCENYAVPLKGEAKEDFFGAFDSIRRNCDYGYHTNYCEARQAWQDKIIKRVVNRTDPQRKPWVIFTCGPMGAGKGWTLSWMSEQGYFPIEGMVHVDPDYFKSCMPEFAGYAERGLQAGTMCHRESAMMQEIAQEYALQKSQHVWVDGSLRDGAWYAKVFDDIRSRFPAYRIAIIYVFAPEEKVMERCRERGRRTGRQVPQKLIAASMREPKESLTLLAPKCDFLARINNGGRFPVLEAVETVDRSRCWQVISKRFARIEVDCSEFPNSLPPICTYSSSLLVDRFRINAKGWCAQNEEAIPAASTRPEELPAKLELDLRNLLPADGALQDQLSENGTLQIEGSPIQAVTLPCEERREAGIPDSAVLFTWVGNWLLPDDPLPEKCRRMRSRTGMEGLRLPVLASALPEGEVRDLLCLGAFAYFDERGKTVALNIVTLKFTHQVLQFGPGLDVPRAAIKLLGRKGRFVRPLQETMLSRGAVSYCWVAPCEVLGGMVCPKHGGFIFEMNISGKSSAVLFPVTA